MSQVKDHSKFHPTTIFYISVPLKINLILGLCIYISPPFIVYVQAHKLEKASYTLCWYEMKL